MNAMTHKGYTAHIEYCEMDQLLIGHIEGIAPDVVGFHGKSLEEIRSSFEEAVEDYLQIRATDCRSWRAPSQAAPAPTGRLQSLTQSLKSDS